MLYEDCEEILFLPSHVDVAVLVCLKSLISDIKHI